MANRGARPAAAPRARCASGGSPRAAPSAGPATASTGAAARTSSAAAAATGSSRRSTRWSISSRTMRGAAMKAGQVLSTVEFPGLDADQSAHLQQRLASLRDDVPAVGWKQMRKVLASEWGEDPERVLASIDPEPAAAASIGQVYRGRTPTGRTSRQGPVPGHRRGGRVGHAQPAHARAAPAPADARPRRQAGARRAARADLGGVRLRARGVEPPPPSPASGAAIRSSPSRRSTRSSAAAGCSSASGSTASTSRRSAEQPDQVRDRYAEIVYRFFYGTARELDLALGDPHPGQLPALRRRARRVLRLRHAPRPAARLPGPGGGDLRRDPRGRRGRARGRRCAIWATCRDDTDWNGALLLEHMRAVSWWLRTDEPLRLAPEDLVARQRGPARGAQRRAHAADAPDDPAARGPAAAADGGPAVPGRDDASRGGGLGRAAAAS